MVKLDDEDLHEYYQYLLREYPDLLEAKKISEIRDTHCQWSIDGAAMEAEAFCGRIEKSDPQGISYRLFLFTSI